MTFIAQQCPQCGGALEDTQGRTSVGCPFCGAELARHLTPIESTKRALEKRAAMEPRMNALMGRYAELLGGGRPEEALVYYESFQYLVLYTAYEVDTLEELEAMATPLVADSARQLGVDYVPPNERGVVVSFEHLDRLIEA